MTLQQLNKHFDLVQQYRDAESFLERLRASTGLHAQNLGGMPRGSWVNDTVGNAVAEITRSEGIAKRLSEQVKESQKPISEWIDAIPSVFTQNIFRLRYMQGLKWVDVAQMVGGGNSPECIKEIVYRELKRQNNHSKNVRKGK